MNYMSCITTIYLKMIQIRAQQFFAQPLIGEFKIRMNYIYIVHE